MKAMKEIYILPQMEMVKMDAAVNLMSASFYDGEASVSVDEESEYTGGDALTRNRRGSWGDLWGGE